MRRCDASSCLADLQLQRIANPVVQRPHRSANRHRLGDDVVGLAGLHAGDAHHRRLERVGASADHGLQGLDEGRSGSDRIQPLMWHRGVRAMAMQDDVELVGRGHDRAAVHGKTARREARPVVQRVDLLAGEFGEQTFVHHLPRAAIALFSGLEDERHRAGKVWRVSQRLGGGHQHRGMAIVTTGVHAAGMGGAMSKVVGLVQGQCVHVGTQTNHRTGASSLQQPDHTSTREPPSHLETGQGQALGNTIAGACLGERQLRMRVQITAQRGPVVLMAVNEGIAHVGEHTTAVGVRARPPPGQPPIAAIPTVTWDGSGLQGRAACDTRATPTAPQNSPWT